MIVVTCGTNGAAFDRLLSELDDLSPGEDVVVQHGPSSIRPRGARCVEFLAFQELDALMRGARVVITHGGAGSVLAAMSAGHRPLVVPRRADRGEAVDDHQGLFVRRLEAEGLATLVGDPSGLGALVRVPTRFEAVAGRGKSTLRDELGAYLRLAVA